MARTNEPSIGTVIDSSGYLIHASTPQLNEGTNTMRKTKRPKRTQAEKYQMVTDTIVREMEKGKIPWRKPWRSFGNPISMSSSKEYQGINKILLGLTPYKDPRWITFQNAKSLGGILPKHSKATHICVYSIKPIKDAKDTEDTEKVRTSIYFDTKAVFNVEQWEGLDLPPLGTLERDVNEIPSANAVVNGYADPPAISWNANAAFYNPSRDAVSMPTKEAFESDDLRMGTLFHELIHSTGHESRLNRLTLMKNNRFGSERYSKEELIAELGSAFLISHTNITPHFKDHAGYIQGWIKVLKNDPKAIVHAAGKAQKAVEYILGS
jgi:antirestriction protein ArdC